MFKDNQNTFKMILLKYIYSFIYKGNYKGNGFLHRTIGDMIKSASFVIFVIFIVFVNNSKTAFAW